MCVIFLRVEIPGKTVLRPGKFSENVSRKSLSYILREKVPADSAPFSSLWKAYFDS
jgi:hypothetical protein